MRKILAFAGAALLSLSAASAAMAQDSGNGDSDNSKSAQSAGKAVNGTIVKVDNDQKMLVIRDDSGVSTTVYWDAATRTGGSDLKEGQVVTIQTVDKDGKVLATSIVVAAKKPY